MNSRLAIIIVAMMSFTVMAAEKSPEEGLTELLAKWSESWNKGDVAGLMKLHHIDSKIRKSYDQSADAKIEITNEFSELIKQFGAVKSAKPGKFIERKGRHVVKLTYDTKGVVPGTMTLKKDAEGNWLVIDFNLDGQGEPELKE